MKTYKIDPLHSSVSFKIRHLLISNVTGQFTNFEATLEKPGDDFSGAKVTFVAQTNSVDTNNEQRDNHLKSADFFDAENHPEIKFVSTGVQKSDEESYKITGDLTIKNITKAVTINATFNGETTDGYGQVKIGFEGDTKVNRKEFGLTWGMVTEAGQVVVGDDVKLQFDVQFTQQ
ncbi:YceI family protein [Arachidicoccus sp.]|jgi:polyisoprenoid-binding protein YceI|uniref:YceI family protein n=1 Tax=Arachidicoccus sp. TaxID=1872624 RepID=UPI003D25260D